MTIGFDDQDRHDPRLRWLFGGDTPLTVALPDTVADIAERFMGEFGGRLDLAVISTAVLDAVQDLECGGPVPPRHIERLARHRLLMALRRTVPDVGDPAPDVRPDP